MMPKRMINYNRYLFIAIFAILSLGFSCSHIPSDLLIVPVEPLNHTNPKAYLQIDTLYKSDQEMCIVVYCGKVKESPNHSLKVDIVSNGNVIFTNTIEDVTIRPQMFLTQPIHIDETIKNSITSDHIAVILYMDDRIISSKSIQYNNTSIINNNISRAVILPFKFKQPSKGRWTNEEAIIGILNTFQHAVYSEVRRVVPDSIPHFIVEEKLGKTVKPECFEDEDCVNLIKDLFGDSLFIFGTVYVQLASLDSSTLELNVYNAKTQESFRYWIGERFMSEYDELFNRLLFGIFYKKGFFEYLVSGKH